MTEFVDDFRGDAGLKQPLSRGSAVRVETVKRDDCNTLNGIRLAEDEVQPPRKKVLIEDRYQALFSSFQGCQVPEYGFSFVLVSVRTKRRADIQLPCFGNDLGLERLFDVFFQVLARGPRKGRGIKNTYKHLGTVLYYNDHTVVQLITAHSTVGQVIYETYDTVTLVLETDQPIPHIPGQSIGIDPKQFAALQDRISMVQELAKQYKVRALTAVKLYSLADSSDDFRRLHITIKEEPTAEGYPPAVLSPFAVKQMQAGDPIIVTGPYGKKFLFRPAEGDQFVLWGAGSGVVPLYYFLEYTCRNRLPNPVRFFDSNKTPEDIIYRRRLDHLVQENPNIQLIHSITRPHLSSTPWIGRVGRLTVENPGDPRSISFPDDIISLSDGVPFRGAYHYICGPLAFGKGIKQGLLHYGVPEDHVSLEAYG